jgi:hypothetical protein
MTVIAALHVLLILFVPWKAGWVPAPVTLVFCVVDLAIIYGVIGLNERLSRRARI